MIITWPIWYDDDKDREKMVIAAIDIRFLWIFCWSSLLRSQDLPGSIRRPLLGTKWRGMCFSSRRSSRWKARNTLLCQKDSRRNLSLINPYCSLPALYRLHFPHQHLSFPTAFWNLEDLRFSSSSWIEGLWHSAIAYWHRLSYISSCRWAKLFHLLWHWSLILAFARQKSH